jgi:hypothetical protein
MHYVVADGSNCGHLAKGAFQPLLSIGLFGGFQKVVD